MSIRLEDEIRETFNRKFPFSLLSNIILYRNDRDTEDLFANEIDHLFHYKTNEIHYLVIIEVKERKIHGDRTNEQPTRTGPWKLFYDLKLKDIKRQVFDQGAALKQFCQNITNSEEPQIQYWITDLREGNKNVIVDSTNSNLKLLTSRGFKEEFSKIENVIKIEHSIFLKEIRKGIPSTELGHPELNNAIQFIKICRQSLDDQIYKFFQPRSQFYALNGCAGMGKSVLLAYSIFVFGTDQAVNLENGEARLKEFKKKGILPQKENRWIFVYAVKKKQIDILQSYYETVCGQIERMVNNPLPRIQPTFRQWEGKIDEKCNILIIDEAHDLSLKDQRLIADWINTDNINSQNKYLLVACDRNQAPKRSDKEENIIDGINFSGHSTRLNRIYRCPFPVYVASIGILFRWFAEEGPGVLLSSEKLREHFGFKPKQYRNGAQKGMTLTMRNDCHPGNNWQQTVDLIDNCSMMYSHLSQFNFDRHEVLWACFEKMEPEFDYTELTRAYTYIDLRGDDADNEIDKNIKGQEFSIVIIEGLPKNINPPLSKNHENMSKLENEMRNCRKNIYITCSRASAFLYFIANNKSSSKSAFDELKILIKQVSRPIRKKHSSGQNWYFDVRHPQIERKPAIFNDIEKPILKNGDNGSKSEENNNRLKYTSDTTTKKQEDDKTIEICKNKKSGNYFIHLKFLENDKKFEGICPEGTKKVLNSDLFNEIEFGDREKMLSEDSITKNQLQKYDYYRNKNHKRVEKNIENRVYESRVKNAKAKMIKKNNSYVILKGSTALTETHKSFSRGNAMLRDKLIQSGAMFLNTSGLYEFSTDVEFNSSSAAACIIAGSSRSGPHDFGCKE